MANTLQMLTRYNEWANKTTFDAVLALPEGEPSRQRPTLFKTMINTLNHIHVVNLIWQAHIEKRSHGIHALDTVLYTDLPTLRCAQQAVDAWYVKFADTLSDADADRPVQFTLIGGRNGQMRLGEVILHVVNHTTYHRGFVADLFYAVPARPPLTDLSVYLTTC